MNASLPIKDKIEELKAGVFPQVEEKVSKRAGVFCDQNPDLDMDETDKMYNCYTGEAVKICHKCGWLKYCYPTNPKKSEFYLVTKKKNVKPLINEFKEVIYRSICKQCQKIEKQKQKLNTEEDESDQPPNDEAKMEEEDEETPIQHPNKVSKEDNVGQASGAVDDIIEKLEAKNKKLEAEIKKLKKMLKSSLEDVKNLTELLVKDD